MGRVDKIFKAKVDFKNHTLSAHDDKMNKNVTFATRKSTLKLD